MCVFTLLPRNTPKYKWMHPRASLYPIEAVVGSLTSINPQFNVKCMYRSSCASQIILRIPFLSVRSTGLYQVCARTHTTQKKTHAKTPRIISLSIALWIGTSVSCVLVAVPSLCLYDAHYARLTFKSAIRLLAKRQS